METIGFTGIRKLDGKFAVYLDSELMQSFKTFVEAMEAIENETTEYTTDI